MSFPRVELIAQNIATVLATVTVANGFNQNLVVERRNRARKSTGVVNHLTVIVMDDPIDSESEPQGKHDWYQPFSIIYFSKQAADSTTPSEQPLLQAWGDICKKLRVDPRRGTDASSNPYAIDTHIDPWEFDADEDGAWDAIICRIRVHYRMNRDDPFTAA